MDHEYAKLSCVDFAGLLASSAPTPGGGGAAALVGALGMALGSMVGALTLGKKKYADVEDDIRALMAEAEDLRAELIDFIRKDADAFKPLSDVYRMPIETEAQRAEKASKMEGCLAVAAETPLEIMGACARSVDLLIEFAAKGSKLALSDAGVGLEFARAAMLSASLSVFINTSAMKDREKAEALEARANAILDEYIPKADAAFEDVRDRL